MTNEFEIYEAVGEMPELPENVIPITQREVWRTNGIKMDLGKLSLIEMMVLEDQCNLRFMEAHTDLVIVRDTR